MTTDELLGNLLEKLESSDLDNLVHEIKAEEAAEINNSGLDGQLHYLREQLGDRDLKNFIEEIASEKS